MMKRLLFLVFIITTLIPTCWLFGQYHLAVKSLPNEKWWGGQVVDGNKMPLGNSFYMLDQRGNTGGNQAQPLFLSNMGRYIWCDEPIKYTFSKDSIKLQSDKAEIEIGKAGGSLKEAFQAASKKHCPASGKIPEELMFTKPQYNTWIELTYNQNQADILKYAHAIVDNGFPTGVLMIDDTWQTNYGIWEFNPSRFSNPKKMLDELHQLGFKVMLWVCPFVSADSENFRKLRKKGALLMDAQKGDIPAIVEWWNGYSGLLDFTNPDAVNWFKGQLDYLQNTYKVDGFKFDAGDAHFYKGLKSKIQVSPNEQSALYAKLGIDYPLNEYRACWKMAGQPLAQRLRDKNCSWEDVKKLMPDMLLSSLIGYAYGCPDLIGGGDFESFQDNKKIEEDMIVRSAQIHAMMPMMQFSVAPWRILDTTHLKAARNAALLHEKMGATILQLAHESAKNGEPIVRLLEYNYPHQGFENVKDEFMLGEELLVAPIVEPKTYQRFVLLPVGNWKDKDGKIWKGGATITVKAGIDELPVFERVK